MTKVNRSEAEAISSDNETPVTTNRRRTETELIKDEMDCDQPKNKEKTILEVETGSRSRRAIYDGVSEFIAGTCQMLSESNVIEPTNIRGLIIDVTKNKLSILCGSCVEFLIQPLHSCIGDIDLFHTTLNYRAFNDENFAHSDHDVHYFPDTCRIECLVIEPCNDYPSFVKLRVFGEMKYDWKSRTFEFIRNYDGRLLSNKEKLDEYGNYDEVGPAMKRFRKNPFFSIEYVPSIWCPQWPNEAKDWPLRRRRHGWPTAAIIHKVVHNGCHVVYVAHPNCRDDEHQCRLSFSIAEVILIQSWTIVQQIVYHLLRFFAKRELIEKDCPKEEEVFCTYHFKTLMLWSCEENSPEWWDPRSVIEICSNLLEVLARWLKEKKCRNYFISRANLFRERINQERLNEISKKLYKFSNSDILCRWFAEKYMEPVLHRIPKGSEMYRDALCAIEDRFGEHHMQPNVTGVIRERHIHKAECTQGVVTCFNRCLKATLDAMKANIPKSIDHYISTVFWFSLEVVHNTAKDIRLLSYKIGTNSGYYLRVQSIVSRRLQFLPCAGIESCLWFYGSMLRILQVSRLLEYKDTQFDSEWFVEQLGLISNQPNIIVSKHHIIRKPLSIPANESRSCFMKALYLMETLNGSNDDIEFQVLSEVSKRLLCKSLSCEDSERDTITPAALSYLAALYYAQSEYQTVLDICSTVIQNRNTQEQETEILNAGWLLCVDEITMLTAFHLIFIRLKDVSLQYYRRPLSLDPRLTSDIFVNYLEISAMERISAIERAGMILLPDNISKQPTFPIDVILMKIANRKSSQLSQQGLRVLRANTKSNRTNQLLAPIKFRRPNDDDLIQLLLTFALQNMTSCYNAICKQFGIDWNVVYCYRAAYLCKCCRYREMLDLCDKILHGPDQQESLREFRFANVTVLPPLDSFFDSDIQCVVGLHTLAYYLSPLNDVLRNREVNYETSTFQHLFARWIFVEKRLLSEFSKQIHTYRHYVLGRHFLARYLKVRHLLEIGCYSDALLELEKLKSNRPFEHMLDVFLRKKLRRLENDIN